ncbi:MAG: hypothetical protein ACYSU0_11595 [Planctomycetota bacterium]|jgi:hypothetical protein
MTDDDRPRSDDASEKPEAEKPSEPEPGGAPTPKSGTPSAPAPARGEKAGEEKGPGGEKKGEEADAKDDDKKDDKKEGKGAAGRVPEHEIASPTAIEKLKERVARAEKEKKPKPVRRRRISDEDRKALWHKAVLKKARKLKIMTDLLLLLLLAIVIAVHFVPYTPFIGEIPSDPLWSSKTGFELMRDLVTAGKRPWIETQRDATGREVEDRATGSIRRKLHREARADLLAYGILAIPVGAALLVLLFLLDYFFWFGRLLPGFSMLWSFGSVGYLMYVRLPRDATWEMIGFGALPAWYLLLVPLFLIGIVSVLRFVVSQRWKRYEFAGLPVPEHLKPKPPEEPAKAEKKVKAEKTDKPDDADKADDAGKADEPAKAEESKEPSDSSEGEKADDPDKPGEGG